MKRYSKAIAAGASAIVALLVTQIPGIDGAALESGIIVALTAVGVIGAPANDA